MQLRMSTFVSSRQSGMRQAGNAIRKAEQIRDPQDVTAAPQRRQPARAAAGFPPRRLSI